MDYTIKPNGEFKSAEIYFKEKPDETIRAALKAAGFRWNDGVKLPLQVTQHMSGEIAKFFYVAWGMGEAGKRRAGNATNPHLIKRCFFK